MPWLPPAWRGGASHRIAHNENAGVRLGAAGPGKNRRPSSVAPLGELANDPDSAGRNGPRSAQRDPAVMSPRIGVPNLRRPQAQDGEPRSRALSPCERPSS